MRGLEDRSDALFLYVSPESFVPADHPLRPIRKMADKALASLSDEFKRMYSHTGRPSVPPEVLLKSLLLQILFSIRSNRLLVEQLGYNILYRWFLGLSLEEAMPPVVGAGSVTALLPGHPIFFSSRLPDTDTDF